MTLLFVSVAVFMLSGVLAAALSRWPRAASAAGAGGAVAGCLVGAIFAVSTLRGGVSSSASATAVWHVPSGAIVVMSDPLAGFFLLPLFVLGGLAAVYGREYMLPYARHSSLGIPWAAFNALLASIALVLTARHAMLFLVAWEVMSLASYLLVVFEYEHDDVRRAGWIYLIAAHVGLAFLIAMFALLGSSTGTLVFDGRGAAPGSAQRAWILVLALGGFGVKAGIVPMHVWLPEAHAAAPSHVSALMSGVVAKMGIYGLVRIVMLTGPAPAWWGRLLIVLGLAGGLYGIGMASYQRDIKRALAYSTIENIGLVLLGLGLGYWGFATGHPAIGTIGLFGGLLHAWNHTLMKGLLFLGAGTILHATGTKDIERLGGLMQRMPVAGTLFVLGSVSIAGLPPLNGFVSEWLLYRSLLDGAASSTVGAAVAFMLAVGAVSAIGALAALCFIRLCSASLLGQPRSEPAASAHEAGMGMVVPMGLLGLACVFVGACPDVVVRAITTVAQTIVPLDRSAATQLAASLTPVGHVSLGLWGATLVVVLWSLRVASRRRWRDDATWGCGYAAPTARMQYTGRSFAQLLDGLMPGFLRARLTIVRPQGLFPAPGSLTSEIADPVTRGVYEPAIKRIGDRFATIRYLQQGALHLYLLYVLIAVVVGLAWASFDGWITP